MDPIAEEIKREYILRKLADRLRLLEEKRRVSKKGILGQIYRDLEHHLPREVLEFCVETPGLMSVPEPLMKYVRDDVPLKNDGWDMYSFLNTEESPLTYDEFFFWWCSLSIIDRLEFLNSEL